MRQIKNVLSFQLPIRGFASEPDSTMVTVRVFPNQKELIRYVSDGDPKKYRQYIKTHGAFCIRYFNKRSRVPAELCFNKENLRAYYVVHELTHLLWHLLTQWPGGQSLVKEEEECAMMMDWLFSAILRTIAMTHDHHFMVP